jgi:hypothetical protein
MPVAGGALAWGERAERGAEEMGQPEEALEERPQKTAVGLRRTKQQQPGPLSPPREEWPGESGLQGQENWPDWMEEALLKTEKRLDLVEKQEDGLLQAPKISPQMR